MPVTINGDRYYRTAEVCRMVGISKATLLRWLAGNIISEPRRDRRGWRLFSNSDLENVIEEAHRLQ